MGERTTGQQHGARPLRSLVRWLISDAAGSTDDSAADRIDWPRCVPFILLHLACLAVLWVGFSWVALAVAVGLYFVRMFFVTGFYHRYFSHRAFRTSRAFQLVMAVLGCTAVQRGPLWWASHHRHHHKHSDEEPDPHSPRRRGFLMSHLGWFMTRRNYATQWAYARDWARYPELRWVNRLDWVPAATLAGGLYGLGAWLGHAFPGLNTGGWQLVVWGFCLSTVVLYHATYTINSLAHRIGGRRFETGDDSRNSLGLALITLGEGWHNNHHHYPAAARQGFYWWEIDVCYYLLRGLEAVGLIRDLRPVPDRVLHRRLVGKTDGTGGSTAAEEQRDAAEGHGAPEDTELHRARDVRPAAQRRAAP